MDRPLDLILRLFCLGQLFEVIRPAFLRSLGHAWESDGVSSVFLTVVETTPLSRWLVYLICLSIVSLGARRGTLTLLALAHGLDVIFAISSNSLSSGYAEKGLLVLVTSGLAALGWIDQGADSLRADRLRVFLKFAAGIAFAAIALNKTNADFLNVATSCSKPLAQRLVETVPIASWFVSSPGALPAWPALAAEVALLPLLLWVPRIGVLYVWLFFTGVAMVGPRATCLVFMALSLVYLPKSDFRSFGIGRPRWRIWVSASLLAATVFWVLALEEAERFAASQLLGRVSFLSLSIIVIGLLVGNIVRGLREERVEKGPGEGRAHNDESRRELFRPRVVATMAIVLSLLLVNELSPYLGLKSKYSLTMWSNLRTDAGRWNSFVFPRSMRVSDRVDEALLIVSSLRPRDPQKLSSEPAGKIQVLLRPFVATHAMAAVRLGRVEEQLGTIQFQVFRGVEELSFEGVGPGSAFVDWSERTRPRVDWFDGRVMSLGTPQACLGP